VRLCVVSVVLVEVLVSLLFDIVEELDPLLGAGLLGAALLPLLCVGAAPAPWVLLLSVLLPELWAIARPTPPASAAAAARMVKLFLVVFISVLLDMETP
jgi:hypothetical protein